MATHESSVAPRRIGLTLNRAKALLQELLAGVSSPRFQKKLATVTSAWGRRELVLNVQREVLPCYGFDGSEYGFEEVALALQPFLSEPKILELSEAITRKLTLPPSACQRGDQAPEGEEVVRSVHSELFVACCAPDFETRLLGLAEGRVPDHGGQRAEELVQEEAVVTEEVAESTGAWALDGSLWRESRKAYMAPVTAILEMLKSLAYSESRVEP